MFQQTLLRKSDLRAFKRVTHGGSSLKRKRKKFFIEILDWVNMGDHLHLKVRFKDKKRMSQFLKSLRVQLSRTRALSEALQSVGE